MCCHLSGNDCLVEVEAGIEEVERRACWARLTVTILSDGDVDLGAEA